MPTIANLSDPITDAGKPVTNATARLTPRISGVASAQTAIRGSSEVREPTAIVLDMLRELELVLLKLRHRLTPETVGETCSVSEEVAQRDRSFRRAKLRCAAGVEALEHLGLFLLRKQLAHRLIELQLALLD